MENTMDKAQQVGVTKPQKYDRMFYWKYDDKSYKSVLYDTETGNTDVVRTHSNKSALILAMKKSQSVGIDVVELEFDSGITKSIDKARIEEAAEVGLAGLKSSYPELLKMLACYAKDGKQNEILKLFSLILSGYMARIFFQSKRSTLYFARAPIVLIRKNKEDLCGGFEHLERIAKSLIVDTGYAPGFIIKNPPIIPLKNRGNTIEKSAYARLLIDNNKHHFSTQYRDTSVFVHSNFFSDKVLQKFAERNKWTTVLLFNKTKIEWARLLVEVDLNNMTLSAWNWKPKKVHHLLNWFVIWLSSMKGKENFDDILSSWKKTAKKVVHAYNLATVTTGGKILQGSEWDLACLQLVSLYAFTEFLWQEEVQDEEQCEAMFDEWANTLLPGSRGQKILEESVRREQEQKKEKEEKIISEFKTLIQYILEYENGAKVYPLHRKESYRIDETNKANHNLDLKKDPWAFVCLHEDDNIAIIKIRYEELLKIAEEKGLLKGVQGRQNNLIAILEAEREKLGTQSYIQATKRTWLNISGKGAGLPGVTLVIEKMQFINEDTRKRIAEKITEVK